MIEYRTQSRKLTTVYLGLSTTLMTCSYSTSIAWLSQPFWSSGHYEATASISILERIQLPNQPCVQNTTMQRYVRFLENYLEKILSQWSKYLLRIFLEFTEFWLWKNNGWDIENQVIEVFILKLSFQSQFTKDLWKLGWQSITTNKGSITFKVRDRFHIDLCWSHASVETGIVWGLMLLLKKFHLCITLDIAVYIHIFSFLLSILDDWCCFFLHVCDSFA